MTDTTLTAVAPVAAAPLVAPDLSNKTVDAALVTLTTASAPFLPAKVRATIYTVGGLVVVATSAVAPVVGGTIGVILESISAACAAVISATALGHINK
jgi:hypothetical protein